MQADESVDYYHVNRRVSWSPFELLSPGAVLDVGGASNPYFRFFEDHKITYPVTQSDGVVLQVPGVRFLGAVAAGQVDTSNLAGTAHKLARHLVTYLRELIWEDVRRREFPHLPSRQRCIRLVPTLSGIGFWLKRMSVEGDYQVLRLRVQGRIHKASESHLLGDAEPLTKAIEMVRQYWLGIIEDTSTQEVIFEGRIRVVDVLSEVEYDQQGAQAGPPEAGWPAA